jgi:hypothetical protein
MPTTRPHEVPGTIIRVRAVAVLVGEKDAKTRTFGALVEWSIVGKLTLDRCSCQAGVKRNADLCL